MSSWLAEIFSGWWAAPTETVVPEVDEPSSGNDDRSSMADFVKILKAELAQDEEEAV
jgi:hypothetical protein